MKPGTEFTGYLAFNMFNMYEIVHNPLESTYLLLQFAFNA